MTSPENRSIWFSEVDNVNALHVNELLFVLEEVELLNETVENTESAPLGTKHTSSF